MKGQCPLLRLAEREFVAEQINNNPNNTRCLWKTIRSCIPKKPMCRKSFTKDDILVANEFNSFFSSVGQTTLAKSSRPQTNLNTISRNRPSNHEHMWNLNNSFLRQWNVNRSTTLCLPCLQISLLGSIKFQCELLRTAYQQFYRQLLLPMRMENG